MSILPLFGSADNATSDKLVGFFDSFVSPRQPRTRDWRLLAELFVLLARNYPRNDPWRERISALELEIEFQETPEDDRRAVEIFDSYRRNLLGQQVDSNKVTWVKLLLGLIRKFADRGGWYGRAELLAHDIIAAGEGTFGWERRGNLKWVVDLFPKTGIERLARVALDRSGGAALGC